MRQYQLSAVRIESDAVAYTTGAVGALTQAANSYILQVGDNVLKYRQNEILSTAKWLLTEASAAMDTARFPRPAAIGGTFFRAELITTNTDVKWEHTLVSAADMSTHPLTSEDSIYWGITGITAATPPAVLLNAASSMGSSGMNCAYEEIYQFYIQKFPEASA